MFRSKLFANALQNKCSEKFRNTQNQKETPTQVFLCKKLSQDVNILIDFSTEHLSLATFVL